MLDALPNIQPALAGAVVWWHNIRLMTEKLLFAHLGHL